MEGGGVMALQAHVHTHCTVSVGVTGSPHPSRCILLHRQLYHLAAVDVDTEVHAENCTLGDNLGAGGIGVRGQTVVGWGCCYYEMQPLLKQKPCMTDRSQSSRIMTARPIKWAPP